MLTGRQNAVYRPLVSAAWKACAARGGRDPGDRVARDQWYRHELWAALGIFTTNDLPANDAAFDELCLHFATMSGDERQIRYWATAAERRAMWRLTQAMQRAGVDRLYVLGIARRMGLAVDDGRTLDDLPAEHLVKLTQALTVHNRRRSARV